MKLRDSLSLARSHGAALEPPRPTAAAALLLALTLSLPLAALSLIGALL